MAMPQAFGFMDPMQAQGMNWEQSLRPPSSYDVMSTLLDAQRQAGQQAYAAQPFADSFLRRFGGPMLEQPQQQMPQQADPQMLNMLMGNLRGAVAGSSDANGNNSAMVGMGTPQETILQGTGSLQSQPWYDEYMAASQAGADTPMVKGNAPAMSAEGKAGIQERRQQRLGTPVPIDERRANVRNNAIYENEQRQVRMGDMSPSQQGFNEVGRFAEGMGGEGDNFLNAYMFGPEYGAQTQAIAQRDRESQAKLAAISDPTTIWANALANGQQIPLASIQGEMADPQGFALGQAGAMSTDFNSFAAQAVALGLDRNAAKRQWIASGRPDPDAPTWFEQSGFLQDVSMTPMGPYPGSVPGLPKLSDLLTWLQSDPAKLNPKFAQ